MNCIVQREDIIWMDVPGSIDNGDLLFAVAGVIAAAGCGGGWK